ncbi:TonB-dependent receptor [Sphingobium sp. RAC03]|uniref:TonB-dependent receptor n=1 Tax=Sphingobium sp. RAC03 TaxID=1843368 RepID=UPI00083D4757|nr:TonB-dependent receptor [Sphingobium sp. RAC03]AOF95184.1 TonB-dependent receptor family protein [Sphingobium sp. RAC03]
MTISKTRILSAYVSGASALALSMGLQPAFAQDSITEEQPAEIVVTGIRASLNAASDIKRNAQGVVDAISAEDIGKFPDTNLAESLQRITGVSIDRSNGEGSTVTVRGFGPEFNLVLLNGRQMPTSTLGDGASAPASRSFDFANLASEGVAGVEVYKSGRATLPTGGIGSTINIKTPRPLDRPGLKGSVAVKGVYDSSRNEGDPITPEISGIISDTFADGLFGIAVSGSWQKRKASVNQANVGWRDGYLGSENNWGSLPQAGDPRFANIENRPGPNDVYQVQQNASYDLNDIERERLNGQIVLQVRPADNLTATLDYTYSRNTVQVRNSNVGIWFNFNDVSSAWTDGPVAGPKFYSEQFGANEGKDLSYSGSLVENQSTNKSLGANLAWDGPGGLRLELDAHHSTAESGANNPYGTSTSVGTAVFGVRSQTVDYTNDLPIISVEMHPGINALDAGNIQATGNAFRNAYFKDRINEGQLRGSYDFEGSILDSLDFGVTYIENKVRSAYGFIQNDTWGGSTTKDQLSDDLFTLETLPDKFKGLSGAGDAAMLQQFYTFNFEKMVGFLDDLNGICGGDGNCLSSFTVDRRIRERTIAPYLQANLAFDVANRPAHFRAGVRYEKTKVRSSALVPIPTGTQWVSANEFNLTYGTGSDFTTFRGDYDNWLPAIDVDFEPIENVKLRASYSHTITRPDYASMQGGRTVDQLFRIGGGTGSQGNPGLLPYKSKNIDLSAEWYYAPSSYLSVGFFDKRVRNFISSTRIDTDAFGLTNPADGPRYQAAVAALGANASTTDLRNYIFANYPASVIVDSFDPATGNYTGKILGLPEDGAVNFQVSTPINSDQSAHLYGFEFAIQHNFWDTGFGTILNYTIVRGDATYDNSQPSSVPQFALTGLSDSANAVLFYDKKGIQARIAYNWRDKFLGGTGPNPFYIEAYGQVDASASWEFKKGYTAFVEAINLNGASRRGHLRSENNAFFASPGYARYGAGLRVNF